MYAIGYDLGSSSVKAALLEVDSGKIIGSATYPKDEMAMQAPRPGWAEQNPDDWWQNVKAATSELERQLPGGLQKVESIGIAYQMHGLVLVDDNQQVLRPSIIWSDSRAAELGDQAFAELGEQFCLEHYLNSPGNFTAAKLRWVQLNEPEVFKKIHKIMLPGDYIAMKLSGEITTTISGLSEGIFWNFKKDDVARELLDHWNLDKQLLADTRDTFSDQSYVSKRAAEEIGIPAGVPVAYRAGDQPNNAFSLNVLEPGEIAATAGTSGVVYGVMDQPSHDLKSRVNPFVHVNYSKEEPRYGVLLCINGTGILNSWMRKNLFTGSDVGYDTMNAMAGEVEPGSDGVSVFPFGNGAERILQNREPGAQFRGISLNRHDQRHICRAGQEGIVNSMVYGMEIMKDMGIKLETIKAGKANMFLSPVFREAFVNATGARLELYETDGSHGAARGAAVGAGLYTTFNQAFEGLEQLDQQEPDRSLVSVYQENYGRWKEQLHHILNQ